MGKGPEQWNPISEATERLSRMVEEIGGTVESSEGKMTVKNGLVEAEVTVDMNGRFTAKLSKGGKELVTLNATDLETVKTNLVGHNEGAQVMPGEEHLPDGVAHQGIDFDAEQARTAQQAASERPASGEVPQPMAEEDMARPDLKPTRAFQGVGDEDNPGTAKAA